jgi:GNAT superfamily N-acetyltransferase
MENFGKIGPKTALKIKLFGEFIERVYQQDLPENCWILSYLAVDRELQGKGIGRHLLSHVFTGTSLIDRCYRSTDTCHSGRLSRPGLRHDLF